MDQEFFRGYLTYLGDTPGQKVNNLQLAPIHNFQATADSETKTVNWSSGTGDRGPTRFEIGGKKFSLEMKMSDKHGELNDNELIISQR